MGKVGKVGKEVCTYVYCQLLLARTKELSFVFQGANPTIVNHNAGVVKLYNAKNHIFNKTLCSPTIKSL
jgi:hypothetical protein